MIRKSGTGFPSRQTQKCVCAEIMRKQQAKARLRFDVTQSRFMDQTSIRPDPGPTSWIAEDSLAGSSQFGFVDRLGDPWQCTKDHWKKSNVLVARCDDEGQRQGLQPRQ